MTPERWAKVKVLFEAALDRPTERRLQYLTESGADDDLREEVTRLLANLDLAGSFLDEPVLNDLQPRSVTPPTVSFSQGQVLAGRFKIIRFVARGGMGEVYEAQDTELQERVAVKVVRPELLQDPRVLQRFKREVHLAKKVTHPNVCRIFDLFRHHDHDAGNDAKSDVVLVSMELLDGETLAQCIRRDGKLAPEEALPLIAQIAGGLDAAHDSGVVHRDLKPGNVMLTGCGETGRVRAVITDFGLALRLGADESQSVSATTAHGIFGTPAYMAPEQIEGGEVTSAADIYAFGLIVFEMVTGVLPFSSDTPLSMAVRRVHEVAPSPRELVPSLNHAWESAILRCLERESANRFAAAQDFVGAVSRADSEPNKFQRLKWLLVAAGCCLVVLACIAVAYKFRVHSIVGEHRLIVPRRSVAVLGFRNLSGAQRQQWLSTAFPEWLTTELAAGQNLRLVSGEDVARMTRDLDLRESETYSKDTLAHVRKIRGADYIVDGSYFATDGDGEKKVRLDLRVQETSTGEVLTFLSDSGSVSDIPSLASRTGLQLRHALGVPEIPTELKAAQASLPSDPRAAELYSEGLEKLRRFNPTGARDALVEAVAAEPGFPLSHAELASAWSSLGYREKAKEEAKKAFDLSSNLPPMDRLYIEGRFREANNEFDKAATIYHALWTEYPDNLSFGLRLAKAQELAGSPKEALTTLDNIRKTLPSMADDPRIDLAEADAAGAVGDYKRRQQAAARASARAQSLGERLLLARALLSEGDALDELGEPDNALERYNQARQIATDLGDLGQVGVALNEMGMHHQAKGDVEGATRLFEQSLAIEREIGFLENAAWTLTEMAITLRHAGKLTLAREKFEEVLAIHRETNNKRGIAVALGNIANVLDDAGDINGARLKYEESLAIDRESGNRRGQAISLGNIGNILYEQGHLAEARQKLQDSIALGRQISLKPFLVWALSVLGDTQFAEGDLSGARKSQEEALGYAKELGRRRDIAQIELELAQISVEEGHPENAEKPLRDAIAEFQTEKQPDSEAQGHGELAVTLLELGNRDAAEKEADRALQMVTSSQNARARFAVSSAASHVLVATGRSAEARKIVDKSLPLAAKPGNVPYQFDLRFARCEIAAAQNPSAATHACMNAIEQDATAKGFLLIARKAGAADK
jgi:tetratricopeptide (TPR) repeat protein/TolB-like protein